MKLNEIQQNYTQLGPNFENLGKSESLYLQFDGEWSVVQLNCFERFLRWLGFYASTQLETIAHRLNLESEVPEVLVDKVISCWNRAYPTTSCPLKKFPTYVKEMPEIPAMEFRVAPGGNPPALGALVAGLILPEQWQIGDTTVTIEGGNLLKPGVSCIVNAANEQCLGGGGIDGVIHAAAGDDLYALCKALPILEGEGGKAIRCRTGSAVITESADLASSGIGHVIHAVGPRGKQKNREELLESTYRSILEVAEANNVQSLAIPAISTGIFGYPFGEATYIALKTIKEYVQAHPGKFTTIKLIFLQNKEQDAEKCGWAIHIAKKMEL